MDAFETWWQAEYLGVAATAECDIAREAWNAALKWVAQSRGAKGGKASRRKITAKQQAKMQKARKAAKLRKGTNTDSQTKVAY